MMRNTLFGRAIWDRKISILATSAGMFIFALLFAALFETFASEIELFADSFPPEFSAVFGDLGGAATPAGFLNIELYSLFLPFTVAIMGITVGAGVIGKEENSGTLELLLASPISRSRIIVHKCAALVVSLFVISFSAWLGVAVGKALFVFDVNLVHVALASLSIFLLGLVYGSATLAGQNINGKSKVGVGLGAGLLVITYFADVVAKLVESLENLKFLSPFYYMDVQQVLTGEGELQNFLLLLFVAAVFYLFAHLRFLQRDTGV